MGAVKTLQEHHVLRFAILCLSAFALPAGHAQTTTAVGFTPASFQVGPGGGAMYTIPIQVPPGTAGMEPKLALVYNSQAGNGGLGVGWSLSGLSSIYRCGRTIAQDGVNTGVTYDNNDRYCLDGQRLVMISPSGTYGGDGVEYRTERESFTKVISHGQIPAPGNGPLWFEVRTKSGQILEYGNTVDSRIEAQGKTSVRMYQVNKISDRMGNYLTVTYQEDNSNGDYRPTRIDYTGNTAAGVAPYASVQFFWEIRNDISSIYVGGSVIKTQMLLYEVLIYLGTTPVKYYYLAYTMPGNGDPSRLGAVLECKGDGTSCLPARVNTWQPGTGSNNLAAQMNWGNPSPYVPRTVPVLADINGDGLADLVYASEWSGSPSILVQFSNGNGFGSPVVVGSADRRSDGTWDLNSVAVADVNGDGRADVITVLGENAGNVRLSTGGGLAAPVNWGNPSPYVPRTVPVLADINGDGLADLVYASEWSGSPSILVQFSNGNGFGSPGFGSPVVVGSADRRSDGTWDLNSVAVADVNGDGRADVITVLGENAGNVRLSTGAGLAAPVNWGNPSPYVPRTVPVLADINGDGLADLVYASEWSGSPSILVQFSNGNGFGAPVVVGSADRRSDGTWDFNSVALADASGDGRADVITVVGENAGNVRIAQIRTPDLITQFSNGLGASTTVTYKPLTDGTVYAKDTNAAWPLRDVLQQGPLYVVSSTSTTNGVEGSNVMNCTGTTNGVGGSNVMNYFYAGAKAHLQLGGFLGFRSMIATDAQTCIKTTTNFRQDYPFQGLPTQISKTQSSGAMLNQVTNSWTDTLTPSSTGKYHRSDLSQSVKQSNDLYGAGLPTVTTLVAYDAYGNPTSMTASTGDGFSKSIANVYTNDTVNWLLGKLTQSQVTSTTPATP